MCLVIIATIHLSSFFFQVRPSSGRYRKGEEYEKTGKDLGKGNMAKGGIVVVKDKATGSENAMKTVGTSSWQEEHVRRGHYVGQGDRE